MRLATLLLTVFISTSALAGDILFLNDSVSFEGKVKSVNNCKIEFKFQNRIYEIPTANFAAIRLEKRNTKLYRKFQKLAKTDTISVEDELTCIKAQEDAQALHYTNINKFLNIVYGTFAPGVSQILGAIYIKPKFSDAKYIYLSENKDLHTDEDYLKCYLKRAKGERMAMRTFGSAISVIVVLMIVSFL
jgi:hypothetical protein